MDESELRSVERLKRIAPEVFAEPAGEPFPDYVVIPVQDPYSGFPSELNQTDEADELMRLDSPAVPTPREEVAAPFTEQTATSDVPSRYALDDDDAYVLLNEGTPRFEALDLASRLGLRNEILPGMPRDTRTYDSKVPPIDALAFYLPFHAYYPERWGIFLTYDGVEEATGELRKRAPLVSDAELRDAAHRVLFFHEYFHHLIECFGTRLEVSHRQKLYLSGFQQHYERTFEDNDEEALATGYALKRTFEESSPSPSLREALLDWVRGMPPGYSRGADVLSDLESAQWKYQDQLHRECFPNAPSKDWEIWDAFPHALSGLARRTSSVSYLVKRDHPIARLYLARELRYRELERHLRDAGCTVERSSRHEIWVTPTGRRFPVPKHPGDFKVGTLKSIAEMALGKSPRELGWVR